LQEAKVRIAQLISVASLALMWALTPAHAEKRVALVIGNDRYANLAANEQLQKAVNDARAVSGALRQIGFEVIPGENLGRQAMLARLDETAQRLSTGDTVFFFFAGHGVAVDGLNYILPADVPVVGTGQITSLTGASIREEDIAAALMRTGARVAVVVLDACRNNPFTSAGTRGVGGERGLAPHEPPSGVFTLYSAGRGERALDVLYDGDRNPNSVFTRVLLPALARADLDLPGLAVEVREEVVRLARTVNHVQRPSYYDETIGGRVYLAGPPQVSPPTQNTQTAVIAPPVGPTMPADPCRGLVTASFPAQCYAPLTASQERGLKPKDSFRECENCPDMVVVPAGKFTMGSPDKEDGPQHDVTIAQPFAVGKFHVTRDQYETFVRKTAYQAVSDCYMFEIFDGDKAGDNRSWRNPGFVQDGSHPVVCVSWADARAYVDWMAKETGKPYRLLSEAEWEYAARGRMQPGTYPRFWFGNEEKDLCRYGNGWDQTAHDSLKRSKLSAPCNDGYAYTSPVGHYEPNPFGLYDMAGNAWQWTADCWHDNYNGAPADGSVWTTGECDKHVARGGSWYFSHWDLRAFVRSSYGTIADVYSGFRVARTLIR
jgi:formylglycine-generating enzyme required for sulfatase activity